MTTSDGRPLFRPEAVEHHARGRTEPKPLDLGARRTGWAFRILVVATLVAIAVAFTVHADVSTRGRAELTPSGQIAVVLLPTGALRRLAVGQSVRVQLRGTTAHGRVREVQRPRDVDGTVVVPVLVYLDDLQTPPATGTAVVRLGHPTLAALLLGRHGG